MTCDGRSLCAGAGNWEGSPADSRCRRTGGTSRRWEAEDRNRCLDVMSARRVKHDCRYPGTVPLQIRPSWAVLWSTDKVRAEPSQDRAYTKRFNNGKQNYNSKKVADLTMALVPIETWLEEKLTWTLKRKNNIIKTWLKIPTSKNLKSQSKKSKLRRHQNVVEKSQSESKKFDAIDVGLYRVRHAIYFHQLCTNNRHHGHRNDWCPTDMWHFGAIFRLSPSCYGVGAGNKGWQCDREGITIVVRACGGGHFCRCFDWEQWYPSVPVGFINHLL